MHQKDVERLRIYLKGYSEEEKIETLVLAGMPEDRANDFVKVWRMERIWKAYNTRINDRLRGLRPSSDQIMSKFFARSEAKILRSSSEVATKKSKPSRL